MAVGSCGNEPRLSPLSVIVTRMLGGTYPVVDVGDGCGVGCRC